MKNNSPKRFKTAVCDSEPDPAVEGGGNAAKQRSPTFLAPGTGFVEDNFSTDRVVDASDGKRWEASLPHRPLTSCRAVRFLTGRGPLPVRGQGVGDPCCKGHYGDN